MPLYLHRVFTIALSGEQHDIVRPLKHIERMVLPNGLKLYARLAVVHLRHEAPALVFLFQFPAFLLEAGIQRGQVLPESVYSPPEESVGDKEVLLHILLLHGVSRFARQYDELPYHVLPAQVDAWVGFAVTLFLGAPHGFRERHLCRYLIEYEIKRPAQHGLYLQYLVARITQVLYRTDDWQSGTHIRLIEELHSTLQRRVLQTAVAGVVARCRHLVCRHHRHVVVYQFLIHRRHIAARRTVHKHAVEDVHPYYSGLKPLRVARFRPVEQFAVVVQTDAVAVEHRLMARCHAHHVELQPLLLHQLRLLRLYLFKQVAAHRSDAADEEIEHLVFAEEERVVYHVERLPQVFCIHHKRDVGLRSSLRKGYHADTAPAQRAEEFSGHARRMLHVLSHDGYRGESALGVHGEHGSRLYLLGKLTVEHVHCLSGIHIAYTYRSGVL